MVIASQLPNDNPVKKSALDYVGKYEAAYGKGSVSSFGGHAWDAGVLLGNAIPQALKKAKPGTVEFRRALRDALEGSTNLAGAHGIFNMTPNDHQGFDQRARVMGTIENNTWKLVK
jgi:branched-chain amino acid transport system substrate-binding protein